MIIDNNRCYECNSTEGIEQHHVIPRSLGGVKTIPLCFKCHSKVHDDLGRKDVHSKLIKEGIKKKREQSGEDSWGRPKGTVKDKEYYYNNYYNVIEDIHNGMSIRKIANKHEISPTTVQKIKNLIYN